MDLKFDANGLIPAIVQDHYTKEVLTLAYMNAESLAITIDEGRTCFFSRSRQQLWRKGETSGNVQHVVSITADCDKDALVVEVVKDGPACHTGAESCFFRPVYLSEELKAFSYEGLYRLIQGRKTDPKEGSYTTYLFEKGLDKILKKVGEECTEVIIGGRKEDMLHKVSTLDPLAVPARTALKMGTEYGAQAVGLTGVGKLEAGCKADITLFDMDGAAWYPRNDLASLLVYSAHADSASTVLVDGKVLMEDKELLTLDKERIFYEAQKCAERLTK